MIAHTMAFATPVGLSKLPQTRVLLYVPSHRQDSNYHSLCYTSRGALAGMRNIFPRNVVEMYLTKTPVVNTG